MKKILLILIVLFSLSEINAQTPSQFKYQAVLRDASGNILANQAVTVDISILQGSTTGTSVFTETHNTTTTAQGLINLNIGSENDMSTVDWSADSYFVTISVNGNLMGTSQLLSVPYALQAKKADNYDEIDPAFTAWDKSSGISIIESQISNLQHFTTQDEIDPLFSGWDKNYADLTNKPSIIDSITTVIDTTTQFVRKNSQWIKNGDDLYYENGSIGIGTSNPLRNLHIAGTLSLIRFEDTDNNKIFDMGISSNGTAWSIYDKTHEKARLLINSETGNIGIGTASPNAKFEVNADASNVGLIVKSNSSSPGNIQEWKNGNNKTLNYVPNDGGIVFENLNTPGKGIKFMADQTSGVSGAYGTFQPVTNNTTGGLSLMPKGTGSGTLSIFGTDALANPSNSRVFVFSANTSNFYIWPRNIGTETAKPLYIYKPGNIQDAAISVATDGDVGVNTATPEAPLHVNDYMKLTPRNNAPSTPTEGVIYYDNVDHELKVFNGTTWVGQSLKHYVGELYGGGIVYYVYNNGQHGLIASLDDVDGGSGVAWSATQYSLIGSNAMSYYNGADNTTAIVAQDNTAGYAATMCNSCSEGGYSDWYLPSIWELNILYNSAFVINKVLENDGVSTTNGFNTSLLSPTYCIYWSSTEYDSESVSVFSFKVGRSQYDDKNTTRKVRAIRAF